MSTMGSRYLVSMPFCLMTISSNDNASNIRIADLNLTSGMCLQCLEVVFPKQPVLVDMKRELRNRSRAVVFLEYASRLRKLFSCSIQLSMNFKLLISV